MVTFILNNEQVSTGKSSGSSLLDFIRYEMGLSGTKVGCREGDCGACTVLMGSLENGVITYKSIVSCLTPLGNAHGKHIVTIEGIRFGFPSLIQKVFADSSATQCGFCTPGFIMAITANSLSREKSTKETLIASMSGNICRCTGYKSIERAAGTVAEILNNKNIDDPAGWLVSNRHLPDYFGTIPARLKVIAETHPVGPVNDPAIAGGTDLMVQKAEELAETNIYHLQFRNDLKGITVKSGRCIIGAGTTVTEFGKSEKMTGLIPGLSAYLKLIASEQIRNMATIGGNIINASPIGDFSIIFLALNAEVVIEGPGDVRPVLLKDLFLDYKKLDINENELIKSFVISYSSEPLLFNFEKVSKRTHLDIASVNSAVSISMNGDEISECTLSAGGVSPIPLFLKKTSNFLKGKLITPEIILQANSIMQGEISPISDVRGSAEYKRLLLRQLLFAHFIKLFPGRIDLPIDKL